MDATSSRTPRGHVLADRYEIVAEIGRGGFGMVYRARQLNIDRQVAIKVLPPQFMTIADVVERFKREAKLTSQLTHPNTITIYDYGQADDLLYIVMEYLEGEDLADRLKRERTLEPRQITQIAAQVLKSLSEAHSKGIVHRDLKPENIFLCAVDDEEVVKVLDFGIAKLAQPEGTSLQGRQLTVTGSTVGTPIYMSPEQAAGEEVDALTDLYALGVILYEMACGAPPFRDDNPVKVMRSHLFTPLPPFPKDNPLSGTSMERVVTRALQKDQRLRYQSAKEFLSALRLPEPHIAALPRELLAAKRSALPRDRDLEEDVPTIDLTEVTSSLSDEGDEAFFTPTSSRLDDLDAVSTDVHDATPLYAARQVATPPRHERVFEPTSAAQPKAAPSEELSSSSSAILSIIEHAPLMREDDPDDVFLLTQPKYTPSGLAPLPAEETSSLKPTAQEGARWSWDPASTPTTRALDSGAYPQQLQQRQRADTQRVPWLFILTALLLIALACGAIWFAFS